jgi:hypothetical protein
VALAALLLLAAGRAEAFSFGTFAPGEKILSIQLSASNPLAVPPVSFDTGTNTLTFQASVSEIVTDQATYSITLGDVIFDSQVMLSSESLIAPIPFAFGGQYTAGFTNGLAADLTITDMGVGGAGQILAADYIGSLGMLADAIVGFPVSIGLSGDFTVDLGGSDATFAAAFGSTGNYFSTLVNTTSNGVPIGTDLCNLIVVGTCITGVGTLDNFVSNPTATIVPLVPEPSLAVLIGFGLVGLGVAARRH